MQLAGDAGGLDDAPVDREPRALAAPTACSPCRCGRCWRWPRAATPSSGSRPDGATELVAVELGEFADGYVEVTGTLAEGDDVVLA